MGQGPLGVGDISPLRRRHSYEYRVGSLSILFDQPYSHSNRTIDSWVEIRWHGNVPPPSLLHGSRHDISGPRFAQTIENLCRPRLPGVQVEWAAIVEWCRFDVIQRLREGQPPARLADVEPSKAKWLVRPLVVASGVSSLVAPGGSGKSTIALALGVMIASDRAHIMQLKVYDHGPVLYLDWEASAEDQAERLQALCLGGRIDMPDNLWHLPQDAPLYRTADSLARFVEREGVKLLIVDSVILARAGDAYGPEETVRFYAALRHIGIPALLVDHKSREAIKYNQKGAYGSVVNDNSARLMHELWPVIPQGPTRTLVKATMTKRNNVPYADPVGLQLDFANQGDMLRELTITQVNPASVVPFPEETEASTAEIVLIALRRAGDEGATVKELALATGKNPDQVRARLNDLKRERRATSRTAGNIARWWAAAWDDQGQMPDAPFGE